VSSRRKRNRPPPSERTYRFPWRLTHFCIIKYGTAEPSTTSGSGPSSCTGWLNCNDFKELSFKKFIFRHLARSNQYLSLTSNVQMSCSKKRKYLKIYTKLYILFWILKTLEGLFNEENVRLKIVTKKKDLRLPRQP